MSTEAAFWLEEYVADRINAERAGGGLEPLKLEAHLNEAAQSHSDWMADTGRDDLPHDGEGGLDAGARIEESGFDFSGSGQGWAENLAWSDISGGLGRGEADRMHEGLMESPDHRKNILDPDKSYLGVGLATDGGRVYLTQNFAETDSEVLVQHDVGGQTMFQPWQNDDPVDKPYPPDEIPGEELPDDRDRDDADVGGSGGGGGCFVATAAYGDRLHPEVVALRRWRDERLVRYRAGRVFIGTYRVVGPWLARIVAHDRASGRAARALIGPLARAAGRGRGSGR